MSLPQLPDVPRNRRGTATAVAVGVFAVLCVMALVLGLRGLFAPANGEPGRPGDRAGAGGTATGPQTTGTTVATSATSATPSMTSESSPTTDAADLATFESPSGNIRCAISSSGARCDVSNHTWKAPDKPDSCTLDWGQGVFVNAAGSGIVCAGDAVDAGAELAYGTDITRGDFRCDSDKDGVTCRHEPSGHAFSVARASYDLR